MNSEETMPDCLKELKEIDPESYQLYLEIQATSSHVSSVLGKLQESISKIQENLQSAQT